MRAFEVDNLRKEDKARMDIRIAQHMGHGIYQLCTGETIAIVLDLT